MQELLRATLTNALTTGLSVRCSFTGPQQAIQKLIGDATIDYVAEYSTDDFRQVPILSVVNSAFEDGYHRVLVLPSDAPTVEPELQHQAIGLLEECDITISPSSDGGFAALGVAKKLPQCFDALDLGSPNLCEELRAMLKSVGYRVCLLPSRDDIDDIESLKFALDSGQLDHNQELRNSLAHLLRNYNCNRSYS